MDILDDTYHQHTTNRWGLVGSIGLNNMTTVSHDHYHFESLAQVSFEFKAASISSPILQAKGFEGESNASIDIFIRSSSWYSDVDHVFADAQTQASLHTPNTSPLRISLHVA